MVALFPTRSQSLLAKAQCELLHRFASCNACEMLRSHGTDVLYPKLLPFAELGLCGRKGAQVAALANPIFVVAITEKYGAGILRSINGTFLLFLNVHVIWGNAGANDQDDVHHSQQRFRDCRNRDGCFDHEIARRIGGRDGGL
ncbi:hypothetical protein JQ631_32025 [Bradyrhizobium manausense]|uniref:hypothetical protein n=1 Tax=Bradyrhizobium manausense TaxID=989370 RepID=UPI001BAC4BFA|nr:hypothetical protein [Bradyrhizobium manausense]MBR0793733.1 hypothetical protein [Bradyrhizobium manausense]